MNRFQFGVYTISLKVINPTSFTISITVNNNLLKEENIDNDISIEFTLLVYVQPNYPKVEVNEGFAKATVIGMALFIFNFYYPIGTVISSGKDIIVSILDFFADLGFSIT